MAIEVHTRRPFAADEQDIAGWHVLHVRGEVDGGTAGLLPTLVLYAVRRGASHVCIDLSDLERVDGSGAAALARCGRAARHAGGDVTVIAPGDPRVAGVLESSGVPDEVTVLAEPDARALLAGEA
jgi:anti-anti-sigma factor